MKSVTIAFAALLITGCNQSQDAATSKVSASPKSTAPPTVAIDVSTPDRALKSYWLAKDAFRKAKFVRDVAQLPELQKLKSEIGLDTRKLMTSDVFSAHQEGTGQFSEYNREIVDIKQDTESRATAMVKIRNSTPISEGAIVSDSDKKLREKGENLKYVLEKEADGWKVAQVYKFDEFFATYGDDKNPWRKVFMAPTERVIANVYVYDFEN
jgi:hypothetical protein